ncbi:MAG: N-acetyltransferase [Nannocystaceae bacterium]
METLDDSGQRLRIREERATDAAAIAALVEAAFGQPDEAELVAALRRAGALTLSLVALVDDAIVGHVAFSPVTIAGAEAATRGALGLAPMAVAPSWQRRGVGLRLIADALDRLRAAGCPAVVVLGHPHYYPRAGFVRASRFGLRWEHDAPDEAFMALELRPGALAGAGGIVRFHPAFAAVS